MSLLLSALWRGCAEGGSVYCPRSLCLVHHLPSCLYKDTCILLLVFQDSLQRSRSILVKALASEWGATGGWLPEIGPHLRQPASSRLSTLSSRPPWSPPAVSFSSCAPSSSSVSFPHPLPRVAARPTEPGLGCLLSRSSLPHSQHRLVRPSGPPNAPSVSAPTSSLHRHSAGLSGSVGLWCDLRFLPARPSL